MYCALHTGALMSMFTASAFELALATTWKCDDVRIDLTLEKRGSLASHLLLLLPELHCIKTLLA